MGIHGPYSAAILASGDLDIKHAVTGAGEVTHGKVAPKFGPERQPPRLWPDLGREIPIATSRMATRRPAERNPQAHRSSPSCNQKRGTVRRESAHRALTRKPRIRDPRCCLTRFHFPN